MWLRATMTTITRAPEDGAGASGGGASSASAPAGGSAASAGGSILNSAGTGPAAQASPGATDAAADWLPAELRADPALKDFKDVTALAASYKATQALVGADKAHVLRMPKDEADEAGFNEVYARLGRPEKPEGYTLQPPADTPAEVTAAFQQAAHKAGLSGKQAGAVMDFYRTAIEAQAQQLEHRAGTEYDATNAALKEEWGNAFDNKRHAIQKLIVNAGGKEALDAFNAIGGGRNALLLKTLAKIADSQAEPSTLRGGSGGGMSQALTPAAAAARIAEKQRDPEFMKAYNTRGHQAHAAAVAEMTALYREAFPTPAA